MTNRFQRLWVGSNHKMYKTNRQTLAYLETLQKLTADIPRDRLTLFVLPPFTALSDACQFVDHSLVQIGAQNMHWAEYGQYTGEISAPMLKEIGVDLVMCGHAERRVSFGDTDQTVNRRVLTSVAHGFQTLLCVGETIEDKMEGTSVERLREQVCRGVQGLNPPAASQLRLAYEPVWAIGEQGESPDPEYVNAMHAIIRDALIDSFGDNGSDVPILYGGSVTIENAANLITQPEVDGLFIGRAAWEAEEFNGLIRSVLQAIEE